MLCTTSIDLPPLINMTLKYTETKTHRHAHTYVRISDQKCYTPVLSDFCLLVKGCCSEVSSVEYLECSKCIHNNVGNN